MRTGVRPRLGNDGEAASHSVPTEDIVQRHAQAHLLPGDGGKSGGRSPGNQGPLVQTDLVLGCLRVENLRTAEDCVQEYGGSSTWSSGGICGGRLGIVN